MHQGIADVASSGVCHDAAVADIDELLPRSRSPRDYLDLVADPRIGQAVLRALATSPYSFVRQAVAEHPLAEAGTLSALPTDDLDRWDRNRLVATIAQHPNADRAVLLGVLAETLMLLRLPDVRPYACALALAERPELEPFEVSALNDQPGASRRMRRGVRRRLAMRPPAHRPLSSPDYANRS